MTLNPNQYNKLIIFDGLAKANLNKNNIDTAIEYWKKILELEPGRLDTLNDLGATLFKNQKPKEAIQYWNKSVKLDPEQFDVHRSIGIAWLAQGDIDNAISSWQNSLHANLDQPELQHQLGRLYYQKGDIEKAADQWYKALDGKPNSAELINDLAWILAVHADSVVFDPQLALELALRGCELTEFTVANYLDTLSVAYAANNNFSKAIETISKAIKIAEDQKQMAIAKQLKKHMALYNEGKAYRE